MSDDIDLLREALDYASHIPEMDWSPEERASMYAALDRLAAVAEVRAVDRDRWFSEYTKEHARVKAAEAQRDRALATWYRRNPHEAREVATLCDRTLDPTGALLGRIRALAAVTPPEEPHG